MYYEPTYIRADFISRLNTDWLPPRRQIFAITNSLINKEIGIELSQREIFSRLWSFWRICFHTRIKVGSHILTSQKNEIRVWEIYHYFRRVSIVISVHFDAHDSGEHAKENFSDDGRDGVPPLALVVDVESEDGHTCG